MPDTKFIDGIEYDIETTIEDDLSSSTIAKTRPAITETENEDGNIMLTIDYEGFTPETKFFINLPNYNPLTTESWINDTQRHQFAAKCDEGLWNVWPPIVSPSEEGE